MKARPAAGTVTMPVAVWPPSAVSLVPSENVMSCTVEPVLWNVTSYMPGAATVIAAGLKPRSKASIAIASAAIGAIDAGGVVAATGAATGAADVPGPGPNVQVGAVALAHPLRAMAMTATKASLGRWVRMTGTPV